MSHVGFRLTNPFDTYMILYFYVLFVHLYEPKTEQSVTRSQVLAFAFFLFERLDAPATRQLKIQVKIHSLFFFVRTTNS